MKFVRKLEEWQDFMQGFSRSEALPIGRIGITKIHWTQDIPYELKKRIAEEFTPDEITEEFRKLPEYLGEMVNSYEITELKFSDSKVETNYKSMYTFKELMKTNEY